MTPWLDFMPRLCGPIALAAALLLAGCGGGGGGADETPPDIPVVTSMPGSPTATDPLADAQPPSSSVAGMCTPAAEKQFVRSYLDEIYLWYDEIVNANPASYSSVQDYFKALLVRTPDRTGQPRDQFSAVLTTAGANALQSSAQPVSEVVAAASATPAVPLTKVIASPGGRQVGYVLFNDHSTGAQDALIAAFTELRRAAVQDLVLDLRYNSGGYLYIARTAATMVTGPQSEGRIFEQLRYNKKRQTESSANTYFFSSRVQSPEPRYPSGSPLPQLGLQRLYVLTSGLTCSASESIINSLRGIDVEVILVGETTCGKPFGFRRKDNCGLAFYAVEFQGYNAKNFGDFIEGFAPTCAVQDDPGKGLGAIDEPLLAAALRHADTGACPAPGTGAARKERLVIDAVLPGRAHAPLHSRSRLYGKLLQP